MEFNLLFSVILYGLIAVLLFLSLRIFIGIQASSKIDTKNHIILKEQMAFEKSNHEQLIQKNTYLENYHKVVFAKLFEITKELLLTKKIILEERYN